MDYVHPHNAMLRGHDSGSWHCARAVNPPVHPATMHAPMPQYYALPDQRRIERVPRAPHLTPAYETIPAITFSVNGWAGVRVKDVLKDMVVIDAANDAVFAHHGWRSTVVNLEWPGYDPRSFREHTNARIDARPGGMELTRQDLAREICGMLYKFHKVVCKYPVAVDWQKWALTAGPEGIRVSDVVLFSIHYYRNVWVPEFYVIE